jgi:hypothetical protein
VRDIKPGEDTVSIFEQETGGNTLYKSFKVNIKSGEVENVTDTEEVPRHTLYSKADLLEDQVLFPEEFQDSENNPETTLNRRNGKQIAMNSTPLTQLKTRDRQWEDLGPEMTRFIADLSTDEEMSDPEEVKNLHKRAKKASKSSKVRSDSEPPCLVSDVGDSDDDSGATTPDDDEDEDEDEDNDDSDSGSEIDDEFLLASSIDVDFIIREMHRHQGEPKTSLTKTLMKEYTKKIRENDVIASIIKAWLPDTLEQALAQERGYGMGHSHDVIGDQFKEFVDRERSNSKSKYCSPVSSK